ncbi:ER lumen protein-retaining receptor erd-2.2 [Impatiens glandulifera]|uniref:ER lumen protein-retaining receptor erd-2.2 n=1 Tax=Impatiens glandulifera TaxID=253017 RepID=UPI001FB0BA70|nr:ER lumen protein-retaining receptor erd-2.2 [Impatiens glandulifera]
MGKKRSSPVNQMFAWIRRQSMKVKIFLAVTFSICLLVVLKMLVTTHTHFFIASETAHVLGIVVLIYKLITKKTCSGLSLKTQELTALFLAVRLYCSFTMEGNIHTVLDCSTFILTVWVICMMRFKLKASYTAELDSTPILYIIIPSVILSALIHPYTHHSRFNRILWAFSVYIETVSVVPQLRLMQNAKMIEPFTGHYVFALGVSRFMALAHWIIQVYETKGVYFYLVGSGYFWVPTVFVAELVQSFILADFCYYYVKSVINGQLLLSIPPV